MGSLRQKEELTFGGCIKELEGFLIKPRFLLGMGMG